MELRPDGPRPPLPDLPRYPAVPGYRSLERALRDLRCRHAAELLMPGGSPGRPAPARRAGDEGFLILDGLWLPGPGQTWDRGDAAYCARVRRDWEASGRRGAERAARVVRRLERLAAEQPAGLRRLVLYQLACLLHDRETGPSAEAAGELGVHASEAGPLAAAVAAAGDFPGPGPVREAAEEIHQAWRERRLYAAAALARRLPEESPDQELAALTARLRGAREELAEWAAQARRLHAEGRPYQAMAVWLGICWTAADDPEAGEALRALAAGSGATGAGAEQHAADAPGPVGGAASAAGAGGGEREGGGGALAAAPAGAGRRGGGEPVTGEVLGAGGVRLAWPGADAAEQWLVLRYAPAAPEQAVEALVARRGEDAVDSTAPLGRRVCYAVLPLRDGCPAGPARGSGPVAVAPGAHLLRGRAVPGGVRLTWRPLPGTREVRAVRSGGPADAPPVPVPCDLGELTDGPLPPGEYRYTVRCGYPDHTGGTVWSAGRQITVRALDWPEPVSGLTVRPPDESGRVTVFWPPPRRGQARLVRWHGWAAEPGRDVSAAVGRLPGGGTLAGLAPQPADGPEVPDGGGGVRLLLPSGAAARLTVITELSGRAVAGDSAVVEKPGHPEDLTVRRGGDGRHAEIGFRWPEPALMVVVRWQSEDGAAGERILPRSRYRAGPRTRIPVGHGACRVTVAPVGRPDASVVVGGPATVELPRTPRAVYLLRWWLPGVAARVIAGLRRLRGAGGGRPAP
ncbi:hypothetical protein [Streptomyces sp. YIM 98790]|uniref:hypothetical protein n=1 Tax=Streptomyces sp. YIM 98790 TaxID=2689077 RepID=UPI00140C92B3|nr:hypothetical protein [Streptomyces sp. YIM 98790]